jgi:hypothetical protein
MKSVVSLILSLIGCGLGFLGFFAESQMLGAPPRGTGGDNGPSPCLSGAVPQVTATPSKITLGQPSVISWSVNLPNRCSAVQVKLNGQPVATSGNRTVSPLRSTAFILVVSETRLGVYGEKHASTRVEVSYPTRVVIDRNTADPVGVLINVLANPTNPQTIELCDVDLDLTGHSGLVINDNTSLIASPGCARGPRSLGPRIFVSDARREDSPLFVIRGDNVLFSGFRLEGPTSEIGAGEERREYGIQIYPFESPNPINNIEISNMEIFHWSGAGVYVGDNTVQAERGRLFNTNENAVRITNNFIHHNRHGDGYGYGVDVVGGAYALIAHNVFDENRHAIAGGSSDGKKDFSGYTARENLILLGGGLHCSERWYHGIAGWLFNCWQTHLIDMHGNESRLFLGDACCGIAGETILIERNTILYTKGLAIKIRGNPVDKAVVDGNVFRHKNKSDAIDQNGAPGWLGVFGGDNITNPIDVRPNNVFGVDPTNELAGGDFAGDGQQDQFMATGVTWWAFSKVTNQWRYLNTMPQKLAELQLRDVDGDGVCDVALKASQGPLPMPKYSKSGTSPWLIRVTKGPPLQ